MSVSIELAIVIAAWVVALVGSILAITFGLISRTRLFSASVVLAVLAISIGYLGCGYWTPVRFFPQLAYTVASDDFQFTIASSRLFSLPLFLGVAGVLLAVRGRWRSRHAA